MIANTFSRRAAAFLLASLFLLTPGAQAQTPPSKPAPAKQPARDLELEAIVDLAPSAPPEFAADVLLRLVESGKITNRALKIELLTQAFELAESAQHPVKKRSMPGSMVDTRSGYVSRAFALNVDRLSLQSRAVKALLPLDSAKAQELFEQIRFPTLEPLGCEELLVYDLALFYDALADVFRRGFTQQERLEGRDIAMVRRFANDLRSHTQVAPLAELPIEAKLPPEEIKEVVALLAGALAELHGDERSFAATQYDGMVALGKLVTELDARRIPSATLLRATREYLVSNFRETPCGDTVPQPPADPSSKPALPRAVQYFNEQFRRVLVNAQLTAVGAEELRNARVGSVAAAFPYWQTSPAKELLAGIKRLRFGDRNTPLPVPVRRSFEWRARLTDFLGQLEAWDPQEPAADYFHQKSVLYCGLVELIPTTPPRGKVVDSFVKFLEQNASQRETRIEWLLHLEDLLTRSAMAGDETSDEVLEALMASRDVSLNLYALLERWTPRKITRAPR